MTVILGFKIGTLPILIGDIVISGLETPETVAVIPTVVNSQVIFPEGSGWTITNLKQKVNIISNNLMIAWAGDYVAAKYVISELKRLSESQQLTKESIHIFFTEEVIQHIGRQQNVVFIGCVANSDVFDFFDYAFGLDVQKLNHSRYGEMMICGTGLCDVQEILETISRQSTRDNMSEFDNAVIETITLCGYLMARDSQSLLSFFGGGYEIATFLEDKFSKIEDYSYLYWLFREDLNGKIDLFSKAYKTAYSNDILLIYSIQVKQIEQASELDKSKNYTVFPIEKILIYPILPLYLNITEQQLIEQLHGKLPIVESSLRCDFVFVVNFHLEKPLKMVVTIPVNYSDSQENSVKFKMSHDAVQLIINNSSIEIINKYCRSFLS